MTQLYYVTMLTVLKDLKARGEVVLRCNWTKIHPCCFYFACHKNLAVASSLWELLAQQISTHICKFVTLEYQTRFEHYAKSTTPPKYHFYPFFIETNSKLSCFIASMQIEQATHISIYKVQDKTLFLRMFSQNNEAKNGQTAFCMLALCQQELITLQIYFFLTWK